MFCLSVQRSHNGTNLVASEGQSCREGHEDAAVTMEGYGQHEEDVVGLPGGR